MAAASPTPNRWLFGAAPDLLLGCGLLYAAVFVAFVAAGPSLRGVGLAVPLQLAVLLFSMPHYGATLLRVYERRQDRRSYTIFSVWATIAVAALFLFSTTSVFTASVLVTVYLTWSPWHYTGQNYGLAMMFLRRRGVDVDPKLKRWVYSSFVLSFVLTACVMHATVAPGYDPISYEGTNITFLPLGIPSTVANVLVSVSGSAYLIATFGAGFLLLRRSRFRDVLPAAALALTQALWFSAPFAVRYFGWHTGMEPIDKQTAIRDYALLVFIGHGIQYLWVTTYYARAGQRWRGYGNYWLKALTCGAAIWTLPLSLLAFPGLGTLSIDAGMGVLLAAAVNIHHFILDGAIWKLRNTRIASVLIRNEHESVEPETGPSWLGRGLWAFAGVGLAVAAFEFYEVQIAYPAAVKRGDYAEAEAVLDRLAWTGYDRGNRRSQLGALYDKKGDLDAAARSFIRSAELRPRSIVYGALGTVEERRENWHEAVTAYEEALGLGHSESWVIHRRLAAIERRRGECEAAIGNYRDALRLRPDSRRSVNDLAWALATCPDADWRQPDESVLLAEKARDSTEEPDPHVLDTLAAAYAAAGRFEDAVSTASRAIDLAAASGDAALRGDIESKLELYRSGRPYVEEPSIHDG